MISQVNIVMFKVSRPSKAPLRTDNKLLREGFRLDEWVDGPASVYNKSSPTPKPAVTLMALDCTRLLIDRLLSNHT